MSDPGSRARARPGGPAVVHCAVLLGACVAATGCANTDPALSVQAITTTTMGGVSLQRDVQPIFEIQFCTSCHFAGNPGTTLSLERGQAYANLVGPSGTGVPTPEVPGLLRVKPGHSSESYLIDKLEGTLAQAPPQFQTQMPLGLPPLDPATIQVIRDWIDQGALDN